jgi:hypothetical protein
MTTEQTGATQGSSMHPTGGWEAASDRAAAPGGASAEKEP